MGKKKDLVGERFGRLLVKNEAKPRIEYGHKRRYWVCICDCGNTKEIKGDRLRNGRTQSCGCISKELSSSRRVVTLGGAVNDYKGIMTEDVSVVYKRWRDVLRRCYEPSKANKSLSYKGCEVCSEWLLFSSFFEWWNVNYIDSYVLDKDILAKGNKVYSPSTCCFVPPAINQVVSSGGKKGGLPLGVSIDKYGKYLAQIKKCNKTIRIGSFDYMEDAFNAYKTAKETHIKEMADKWKGKIANNVYQALYNYKIEITD